MSEIYAIIDLNGYVSQMRTAAANTICEDNEDTDLDDYISLDQMVGLVKSNCLGFDDEDRPLLNEEINNKIFDDTIIWLNNIVLAKLAGNDLIECAWDNEFNDMIFWSKKVSDNESKSKSRRKNKKNKR